MLVPAQSWWSLRQSDCAVYYRKLRQMQYRSKVRDCDEDMVTCLLVIQFSSSRKTIKIIIFSTIVKLCFSYVGPNPFHIYFCVLCEV